MANVIDILITAKDQATAAITRVETSLGGLNSGLSSFGGVAGIATIGVAALGAGAAAAVASVRSLAHEAEHLSNVAQQTGVSVDAIQIVAVAFKQAGLSAEDAGVALKYLNKSIADGNPLLAQLGITSKDAYTAFLQLSDVFRAHADGPNKVAAGLALMGRAGNIAIPVMNQGSVAIRALGVEARSVGAILSEDMVGKLKETDDAFDHFKLAVQGLKDEMAIGLVPAVTSAINAMTGFVKFFHVDKPAPKQYIAVMRGDRMVIVPIEEVLMGPSMADLLRKPEMAPPAGAKSGSKAGFVAPFGPDYDAEFWRNQAEMRRKSDQNLVDFLQRIQTPVIDSKTRALMDMRQAITDIMDAGNIMADSMNLAFNALDSGFRGIFQSIGQGGRAFADALRQMFRGLVDAILAELARLAAAAVFKLLLSFVTGGMGGIPNVPGPVSGKVYGAVPVAPDILRSGGGGNTFNITTIAPASVLAELLDPTGSFRRANLRIAELGAL